MSGAATAAKARSARRYMRFLHDRTRAGATGRPPGGRNGALLPREAWILRVRDIHGVEKYFCAGMSACAPLPRMGIAIAPLRSAAAHQPTGRAAEQMLRRNVGCRAIAAQRREREHDEDRQGRQ